jgi:hypothetical protein
MPANELFSFEILVNGQPLIEYSPETEDYFKSTLDRVSFVEASPGSEFSVRVTYLGARELTSDQAYSVNLYIDGSWARGKRFHKPEHSIATIRSRLVAGSMEQP